MTVGEMRALTYQMPDSAEMHFHGMDGDFRVDEFWPEQDGAHVGLEPIPTGVTGLANETPAVQQGHPDSIDQ